MGEHANRLELFKIGDDALNNRLKSLSSEAIPGMHVSTLRGGISFPETSLHITSARAFVFGKDSDNSIEFDGIDIHLRASKRGRFRFVLLTTSTLPVPLPSLTSTTSQICDSPVYLRRCTGYKNIVRAGVIWI